MVKPVRILCLEDDQGVARLLQKRLQRQGHEVTLATDGQMGLALFARGTYDLLITDNEMGSLDGLSVIRALRAQGEQLPIVMVTGAGDEAVAVDALTHGASDYLIKDAQGHFLDRLPQVIDKLIEQRTLSLQAEEAQQALRENEKKFRAMFEHAPVGVVLCERDGGIVQANDAFCRLTGYKEHELRGLCCDALLRDSAHRELKTWFAQEDARGPLETIFLHREGHPIPVQLNGGPFSREDGSAYIWLFIEDIRARKALQDRLLQANKMEAIGELAANIAHEMNNPLGIISAKARLLLLYEQQNMSSRMERELSKMIGQCDRLGRLTKGLLDYSRPSFGKKVPMDVLSTLEGVFPLIERRLEQANCRLIRTLDTQLPLINANAHELEQIFLNLLNNAIEAMPPDGGTIRLCATCEAGASDGGATQEILVSIEDDGSGIAPELLPKVFEPFFTTKEKGTGLGLSIAFGLTRSHGGELSLESSPGQGTRCSLRFPTIGDAT